MLWNISFLDFRKANGCGARYTPLKTLLVHPSPLPLSEAFCELNPGPEKFPTAAMFGDTDGVLDDPRPDVLDNPVAGCA